MTIESILENAKDEDTKHIIHPKIETSSDISNRHNDSKKIVSLAQISNVITFFNGNKKIVHCHGVFDLLHIGHIKHLQQAKNFGDILIVTITADIFVNKGPGRPHFSEKLRAEALVALSCVDFVVINYHATAVESIKIIKPDFYVKGIEYQELANDITGKISEEEEAVKSTGGQLIFTQDVVFSSSSLLNRYFTSFSPEVNTYLERFKSSYNLNEILTYLKKSGSLKVLLIGEAIIDIYHYGEAIGKSGKEPILVTKYHREEMYIGGVLAVASHLSSFCSKVTCLTTLGEQGEYETFIRNKLKKNIDLVLHYKKDSPTTVKRRYIEEYSSQKLFEIYEIDDCYFEGDQKTALLNSIEEKIAAYDVVIVTDYGHGLLDQDCIDLIESKAKFLAVNSQANAGNHGFNCISKYKKADHVCIASRELQLNYRQKHITVHEQIERLMQDHAYGNVVITNGVNGSLVCKPGEDIISTPALTCSVKDRVGAGDAVLAITSILAAQNAPAEVIGFIGNVVGAEAVNIMGNKDFIEKISLMKHITHLMK